MARSLLLAVIAVAAACSHDMSDREYCTRRQMAWEMAFPNLPQTDDDRSSFVDACVTNLARAHGNGELARSMKCMNDLLVGHGHAREQFDAFTKCEQVDPSRER
ncbi:MAG TPA: hypothetical protein VFP84_14115 [Kofleriaceae bacterium]|nr:hypothetical protein [Kofleriaceae bacterium]